MLRLLRRSGDEPAAGTVEVAAQAAGLVDPIPEGLGDDGVTFQEDLRRLVDLAAALPGDASVSDFVSDLEARFGSEGAGRGVQLLTYHRAKGLEFEVVFLPFLVEGELPFKQARTDEALAEERRLLYVGLTRAKRLLALSWSGKKPSRFLDELGLQTTPAARSGGRSKEVALPTGEDGPVFTALRAWRLERAREDGVPAYVVFDNKTLAAIAVARPATRGELAAVHGVGPTKLDRYGDEVLGVLRDEGGSGPAPTAPTRQGMYGAGRVRSNAGPRPCRAGPVRPTERGLQPAAPTAAASASQPDRGEPARPGRRA